MNRIDFDIRTSKMAPGFNRLDERKPTNSFGLRIIEGHVQTRHGYVMVDSNLSNHPNMTFTYFRIIREGYSYSSYVDRFFEPKALVTAAKQFAEQVFTDG
jgi:hypothetical protein